MSDTEQIQSIKQQALAQIADLRASPKPSYTVDGQTVRWADYLAGLQATVDWCDRKLAAYGPFEERTQAHP